jgi:hypothetical protein
VSLADFRHLLEDVGAGGIQGRGALSPCAGVRVVEVRGYVLLGRILGTVADQGWCEQDELKEEAMDR